MQTKADSNKAALPAHLMAALKKYEQKKAAFGFTVTDVTPKGYGPADPPGTK